MKTTQFPDFLQVKIPHFKSEFERIAKVLLNGYQIIANAKTYDIIEIEFYFDCPPKHSDPSIYKKFDGKEITKNLSIGNWLFHYSGIDLTIGDNGTRGGILIRAIKDDSRYIIGPWRTMLELLNHIEPIEYDGQLKLQLVQKAKPSNFKINASKRIGVNAANGETPKLYRFIADIKEIEKSNEVSKSLFKQYYGDASINSIQIE